ncbi:hypothetical protein WOLCODRAFT_19702 [Wolfiporia cocos MD-104 SS10]|uniref:Uncharacterized protein n=1 Tax=Wolfiporia cocos (strain MD-104) TaxID=742152 RepID=A0A2H3IZ38_WOLCO|nr:hypothetical protein WOLCODRAFT_19702 [Wolfiporia cocos MD-104 SS10]
MNARCGFVLSPAWNPVSLYISTSGRIIAIANNTPMYPNSTPDIDLYEAAIMRDGGDGKANPLVIRDSRSWIRLESSASVLSRIYGEHGWAIISARPVEPYFDLLILNSSNGAIDNCSALLRLPEYWSAQGVAAVVAADHP